MTKKSVIAALLLSTLLTVPGSASAYTLLEEDELKLSVGSLARLGYTAASQAGEFTQGPYFQFARLSAGVEHETYGKGFVQIEGARGTFQLLDAFVELRPSPWSPKIAIRGGVFRLPTTADFHVGAPKIPFSNRSMLISMQYPRLPGAEVLSDFEAGPLAINARLGLFQPTAASVALLPDGQGNFLSARVGVDLESGLGFHLAYLRLLFADNEPVVPPDDPMAPAIQPVAFPEVIDAAVTYRTKTVNVHAEMLIAPNDDDASDELNWSAYLHGAYRFPISNQMDLGPGARYGVMTLGGVMTHRVTAGASLFIVDHHLKFIPNYELSVSEGDVGHAGFLTLQGWF